MGLDIGGVFLGIDTSNYTTSAALYDTDSGVLLQQKRPLPVKPGELGLRQSDAVFAHVKNLGGAIETLFAEYGRTAQLRAIGVSATPTNAEGSYMPCFLAGEMAARCVAASAGCPVRIFSHQEGHIAAALYAAKCLDYMRGSFLAFHVSGGTTDCVLVNPGKASALDISLVCKSLDLHAGQAVDRAGAMLGIPFPAGPGLEKLALESQETYNPKPTLKGMDCCLSGLENKCRDMLAKGALPCDTARYCLDYLAAALTAMASAAVKLYPGLPVVFAGGVMSNSIIRGALESRFDCVFAPAEFSTDNAAGIAVLTALAVYYVD